MWPNYWTVLLQHAGNIFGTIAKVCKHHDAGLALHGLDCVRSCALAGLQQVVEDNLSQSFQLRMPDKVRTSCPCPKPSHHFPEVFTINDLLAVLGLIRCLCLLLKVEQAVVERRDTMILQQIHVV